MLYAARIGDLTSGAALAGADYFEIEQGGNSRKITANDIRTFFTSVSGMLAASNITFSPTGGIAATNVQAAIAELDTEKLSLTGGTVTGVMTFSNNINMSGNFAIQTPGASASAILYGEGSSVAYQIGRFADDAFSASFNLVKGRGTIASKTAVNVNDSLGTFRFYGTNNSASFRLSGFFEAIAIEPTWDSPGLASRLVYKVCPLGSTTPTEVLRLEYDTGLSMYTSAVIDQNRHFRLRSYTVATVPSASPAGMLIYVSNGTSNKRLAVSDGTNWRFPDGAIVS